MIDYYMIVYSERSSFSSRIGRGKKSFSNSSTGKRAEKLKHTPGALLSIESLVNRIYHLYIYTLSLQ